MSESIMLDGEEWVEVSVEEYLRWKNLTPDEQRAAGYVLRSEQGWVCRDVTFNQVCLSPFLGGGHGRVLKRLLPPACPRPA